MQVDTTLLQDHRLAYPTDGDCPFEGLAIELVDGAGALRRRSVWNALPKEGRKLGPEF